jgi:cell wall-associated NlpC family hydrolase
VIIQNIEIKYAKNQNLTIFDILNPKIEFTIVATKKEKAVKKHGICTVACAPIRARAEDSSEMISQLLFGETFTLMTKKDKSWIKVACTYDGYEGWMDLKQATLLTEAEIKKLQTNVSVSTDVISFLINEKISFPILLGSSLPSYDGMSFKMPMNKYVFNGNAINPETQKVSIDFAMKIAKKYLNAPYLWGGRSPFGIDCSGFAQTIFKLLHIPLPRDAYQQVSLGKMIDFVDDTQDGDLAFFDNADGKIIHVGIVLSGGEIIHSSGKVRIDKLDHEGIYNRETKKYTHKLRYIKRLLETKPNLETTVTVDKATLSMK